MSWNPERKHYFLKYCLKSDRRPNKIKKMQFMEEMVYKIEYGQNP